MEIQTEIRRENIVNDSRKAGIDSKIKSNIKTSKGKGAGKNDELIADLKKSVGNSLVNSVNSKKQKSILGISTQKSVRRKSKELRKKVSLNIGVIRRTVINATSLGGRRLSTKKGSSKKGKRVGTAIRGVSGAALGAASKARTYTNNDDTGNNLAQISGEYAIKGVGLGLQATKKVFSTRKPAKSVKKQVKKIGKRMIKTAIKKQGKKLAKKAAKSAAKATQRTVKTAVKATANAVKATAKIVANATKIAAQAVRAAVQAAIQAAQAVGEAVVTLLATPVGWIILAVVAVVIIIVLLFNMLQGAASVPVSAVSGMGSSLSWLFGGNSGSSSGGNSDIADLYSGFDDKAHTAMNNVKTYYQGQISGISFGDRDTLVFNGASFYPASAADDYVQDYFDNLDYDDYKYLMEMCYIKKLRDERAAQGLSENDLPEVTIDENDIKDFLITYCYSFNIEIIGGQACPTLDCCSRTDTSTSHCGGGDDCSNHNDEGECLGHEESHTTYYCDHSHIKAIVTLQETPKYKLENDILVLTDDERDMLNLGLDILNDALEPQQTTGTGG